MATKKEKADYRGVRFYSVDDMSARSNLIKAEKVINKFNENSEIESINQIIELYNIIKFFDCGLKLPEWDEDYYRSLKDITKKFNPMIGRFCATIGEHNLLNIYEAVDIHYLDSFWEIFEQYCIFKRIGGQHFITFISNGNIGLWRILLHKKVVDAYDLEIRNYMMKENKSAETIINHYLVKSETNKREYFFPKSLTNDDKLLLIQNYIHSAGNPNYLDVIIKAHSSELLIPDKMRLSAKKKYDEYWKEYFVSNSGMKYGPTISFAEMEEAVKVSLDDPMNPEFVYSTTWISENLDYPTLLNNFIYLFEFVDGHYRSTFPSKSVDLGIMERFIGLKTKKEYICGMGFNLSEMITTLQLNAYYRKLLNYNIRLEDLFKWFFEDYLKEEFGAEGFMFNAPSSESTFLEKNRTICSELDSIIKQFNMYVEDNYIDKELLEISSKTPLFSQVKSFTKCKYGYITDNDLNTALHLLFSDQALLSYTECTKDKYNTFDELLLNEVVTYSDFYDYQKPQLDFLIDQDIILKNNDGVLELTKEKWFLLKDIYTNEVVCFTYYQLEYFDELVSEGKIKLEGTLLSKPEQDYLDYVLNDHSFDNGKKLRNKYVHGSNPSSPSQHEMDYYQLLKIFALIIIKINEEFCRRDDTWSKQN